jgi:hypothetical protein
MTTKILIATTNPGKIQNTKLSLGKIGAVGYSFADLGLELVEPEETKAEAEDIAREKAIEYTKQYKGMPVLARDDTVVLVGVDDEDDPKNHNKEFIARRAGEFSDENGLKVFSEIAKKYGGEIPIVFSWGFALAWWDGDEIKCVSGLAQKQAKLIDKPSQISTPGYSFSAVTLVDIDGVEKYDSELSDDEILLAYQDQGRVIGQLIAEYERTLS